MLKENEFYQILSPNSDDTGVWIHQDAYFSMGTFDAGKNASYTLKNVENGLYVFVIFGEVFKFDDWIWVSTLKLGT